MRAGNGPPNQSRKEAKCRERLAREYQHPMTTLIPERSSEAELGQNDLDERIAVLKQIGPEALKVARRVSTELDVPLDSPLVLAETARSMKLDGIGPHEVEQLLDRRLNPPQVLLVTSASDLLAAPAEPLPEVFADGQLIRGECFGIVAPPGIGKTWLMMQAGLALAYGVPWLGKYVPPQPFRCLYLTGEGRAAAHRKRLDTLVPAYEARARELGTAGTADNYLTIAGGGRCGLRLDVPSSLARLKEEIERNGVDVILLDTFRTFHAANENAAAEMQAVLDPIRELLDETDCAAIITHHTKKGQGRNAAEAARGGSWQEHIALGMVVNRDGDVDRLRITPSKGRNGPEYPEFKVRRDPVSLAFEPVAAADLANAEHPELEQALRASGGSARLPDLVKLPGLPTDKVIKQWVEKDSERYSLSREGGGERGTWVVSLLAEPAALAIAA